MKQEITYKGGKAERLAMTYYENGNLRSEGNFKNGKKEGLIKFYYEDSNLILEMDYKDGKAVSGYVYDESGNKTKMNNAHLHKWNKRME